MRRSVQPHPTFSIFDGEGAQSLMRCPPHEYRTLLEIWSCHSGRIWRIAKTVRGMRDPRLHKARSLQDDKSKIRSVPRLNGKSCSAADSLATAELLLRRRWRRWD